MSYTPSLFDVETPVPTRRPPPFQKSSQTSRDAARRAEAFIGQQGARVLAWFVSQGPLGATQKQCSEQLEIARASVCARVNALEKAGRLVKLTQRIAGCQCYRSVEPTL